MKTTETTQGTMRYDISNIAFFPIIECIEHFIAFYNRRPVILRMNDTDSQIVIEKLGGIQSFEIESTWKPLNGIKLEIFVANLPNLTIELQ